MPRVMKRIRSAVGIGCVLALIAGAQASGDDQRILAIQDAMTAGDLVRASQLLNSALEKTPADGGLLNLRGVMHAQRGEISAARQDFETAVKQSPNLTAAWQNLARACQADAVGKSDLAECSARAWQRVLKQQPKDTEARRGMALALERLRKYSESLLTLDQLAKETGSKEAGPMTADLMIRCLDLSGLKRLQAASDVAKRLGGMPDFGEGDLEAMSGTDAGATIMLAEGLDARGELKLAGLERLALAYEAADRLSDARKALERCALAEPNNARHLLELARVAERQHDHEGALGYLGHARELTPNDARVHFLFGMVAAEMELPIEARKSLERALELAPGNPDYNYALGAVILTTRDAASATRYFEKYVAARPGEAKGHYALGVAEFTSGDYAKAKAEMQGVERDPQVGGGAQFFLGRIARLEGDVDGARQHLASAIRMMPKFAESHTEMARLWMLENNQQEARAELKRALELDPDSFQANAQLLALYKKTHDERAAAQSDLLKRLDEERSRRAELMLRSVEIRP
jgi:tetratricopeptide (TPR) repeat protein